MNEPSAIQSNPQFAQSQKFFPVISVPTKNLDDFDFQSAEQTNNAPAANPVSTAFYMGPGFMQGP